MSQAGPGVASDKPNSSSHFHRCTAPNFRYKYTCVRQPETQAARKGVGGAVRQAETACAAMNDEYLEFLDAVDGVKTSRELLIDPSLASLKSKSV